MKLCDVVLFFNELDLLKVRLAEHYDHVDKFYVVEATRTFTYRPKPLYYQEHRASFAEWADKIEHVVVDADACFAADDAWHNERCQRGYALATRDLARYDYLLQLDCDEIVDRRRFPDLIALMATGVERIAPRLHMAYYFVNALFDQPWAMTRIFKMSPRLRPDDVSQFTGGTPTAPLVGWHFGYLGSPASIAAKIQSFSHTEYNTPEFTDEARIAARMQTLADPFGRDNDASPHGTLRAWPIGPWLPTYMLEHREAFARFEYHVANRGTAALLEALSQAHEGSAYELEAVVYPRQQTVLRVVPRALRDVVKAQDGEAQGAPDPPAEQEVAQLRQIVEEQAEHLAALDAHVKARAAHEAELRALLLEAHDQLLQRDEELQRLRQRVQEQEESAGQMRAELDQLHLAEVPRLQAEHEETVQQLRVELDQLHLVEVPRIQAEHEQNMQQVRAELERLHLVEIPQRDQMIQQLQAELLTIRSSRAYRLTTRLWRLRGG